MKFIKILTTTIVAAGVLVFANSCEDNLNIPQHSVSSIDSFYSTDEEVEQGIVAVYNQFKTVCGGGTSSVMWMSNFFGDDYWVGGGSRTDGIYYQYSEFGFGSDDSLVKNVYKNLYTLIYRCNLILEKVQLDTPVAQRAKAEAKVFRGWAYFYLGALWGTAPVVDHILTPDEYLQGNSEAGALYTAAVKDLKEAIGSGALTDKTSLNDKTYRVTKAYAQAMLGKVYLWQKNYSEAVAQFDAIINSNKYALKTDLSNVGDSFEDVCEEDLFCFRGIDDANNSGANSTFRGTWTGLRGEKYDHGFATGKASFASFTFGFMSSATKKLYDTFVSIEGEDGYRLNNFIFTYDQMMNVYDTRVNSAQNIYDCEGFFDKKYAVWLKNTTGRRFPQPLHVMRYDEVLCFAAEAAFMANDKTKAMGYINQLRTRAKAPTITDITLQTIKDESYVELCFEGVRYLNLIRWGDAAAALGNRGAIHPHLYPDGHVEYVRYSEDGKVGFVAGRNELLPFPADEMACNPNMTQNPGW